jgi:hypothetical protein
VAAVPYFVGFMARIRIDLEVGDARRLGLIAGWRRTGPPPAPKDAGPPA